MTRNGCSTFARTLALRRRGGDRVDQAAVSVDGDVRLHPKVPLVALLDLVHLGVTLAVVAAT